MNLKRFFLVWYFSYLMQFTYVTILKFLIYRPLEKKTFQLLQERLYNNFYIYKWYIKYVVLETSKQYLGINVFS
jgi:hypothetical protein